MTSEPDRNQPAWEPPEQLHAEERPRPVHLVVRELRKIYNDALKNLVDPYFIGQPELREEHREAMRDYISENYPREKFVQIMLELRTRPSETGINAETDPGAEFAPQHYHATRAVAAQVVPLVIRREKANYVFEFIEKDPLHRELMQIDPNGEYTDFIHWVKGEVTHDEFRKDPSSVGYRIQRGDKLYFYSTPNLAWEEGKGQRGYLLVRNGIIQGVLVTAMN